MTTAKGMAFVTGGSRGIGAAISKRLAAEGYAVAVGYANNADAAAAVVGAIESTGGSAQAFQVDVADFEAIESSLSAAEKALGALSVYVANAGVTGAFGRISELSADQIEQVFRVNSVAPLVCAQAAARRLSTREGGSGGSIVLMSSVAARLGGAGSMVPYAASKGAIESAIKGLAGELADDGIRVNGIAPGVIETDMPPPELIEKVKDMVPMRRLGRPEEIADAVYWLVSDQSSFMTGESITISGGR